MPPEVMQSEVARYRAVLGHFCTGVTVVTGMSADGPVGFACQSFAALSLDPPLVLFCPQRTSRSWAAMASSGAFCVNVLAEDQRDLSVRFAQRQPDRFEGLGWRVGQAGVPVVSGCLAVMECSVSQVVEAGDHAIFIGEVEYTDFREGKPLLYFASSYRQVSD